MASGEHCCSCQYNGRGSIRCVRCSFAKRRKLCSSCLLGRSNRCDNPYNSTNANNSSSEHVPTPSSVPPRLPSLRQLVSQADSASPVSTAPSLSQDPPLSDFLRPSGGPYHPGHYLQPRELDVLMLTAYGSTIIPTPSTTLYHLNGALIGKQSLNCLEYTLISQGVPVGIDTSTYSAMK